MFFTVFTPFSVEAEKAEPIRLWHSYRGVEREALEKAISQWNREHPVERVEPLAVPFEAYGNKLTSAVPRGNGPDLFIAAHERLGDWARSGIVRSLDGIEETPSLKKGFFTATVDALTFQGRSYGWPLSFKSTALFVYRGLLGGREVPRTTDELERFCTSFRKNHQGKTCLAYEAGNFYHHAAWLYGFGGKIFSDDGSVRLNRPENAASLAFVKSLSDRGDLPAEPTSTLVSQLFNEGKAAFVINGPWFMGEIDSSVPYDIHPLPRVSATGKAATPFLTVEGLFLAENSKHKPAKLLDFARFLSEEKGARIRLETGRQTVAWKNTYAELENEENLNISKEMQRLLRFKDMVDSAIPMPNDPLMRSVWEPANQALRQVLRGAASPEKALEHADYMLKIVSRPAPKAADPLVYLVLALGVLLALVFVFWRKMKHEGTFSQMWENRTAYAYIAPAAVGMLLLVFTPFVVGTLVSLFAHRAGEFTFVGLSNFASILACKDYSVADPLSFYFTLGVTVMWTAANVALHVSLGMALALLLRPEWLKLRGVYRVLLIVPWAVPNYITALIWKGMFHRQFGAVNGLLDWLGLEPVAWFSHFWTAFAANLATNVWLGFPFMMVVTLGALQAIPAELEEAAEVDGAGRVTRFFRITLPLVKPALLPAVILGGVWTFNMFNIIYLVSGGEPDGSTEILISEAYRWAFTRQEQYGYAAAYATLIFLVLLLYGWGTKKLAREA